MRRLLLFTVLGALFFSADASARMTPLHDYQKQDLYGEYANSRGNRTCQQVYGDEAYDTKPVGMQCDSQPYGSQICYYNCHCPNEWSACTGNGVVGFGEACVKKNGDRVYASCVCDPQMYHKCEEPTIGIGDACTINDTVYYTSCQCPDEYNKTCTDYGQTGDGEACFNENVNKFKSCKCEDDFKYCIGDEGKGQACTAEGDNKYRDCTYGEVTKICRAVTGSTPNDNSTEYQLHANAFRGIENTRGIINAQGGAATAAYSASVYRPKCVQTDDELFSAGKWYLPAVGEMLYLSGADFGNMTGIDDNSGINDTTYELVNNALIKLRATGPYTEFTPFLHPTYRASANYSYSAYDHWTSSQGWGNLPYFWAAPTFFNQQRSGVYLNRYRAGYRAGSSSNNASTRNYFSWYHHVRPVMMLQSCFEERDIHIGDVVFSDMSVGNADSYKQADGCTRYPVGIIYWISKNKEGNQDNRLVRIISVRPIPFVGDGEEWIYDADNPDGNCGDIQNCTSRRVSWVNEKNADYSYPELDISENSKDAWGCSTLKPELSSCKNPERPRTVMKCTPPTEMTTEYSDYRNAFKGIEYTNAIIKQHPSATNSAAHLASKYKGRDLDDGAIYFGKNRWYLPSAGEMLYLSGVDFSKMNSIVDSTSGIRDTTFDTIENTLADVATTDKGGRWTSSSLGKHIASDTYCSTFAKATPKIWTSSEADKDNAYYWDSTDRQIKSGSKKDLSIGVRPVIMFKDAAIVGDTPKVGTLISGYMEGVNFPVVYTGQDTSPWRAYTSAYDWPVGVVYYVSPDKRIIRIIACREASRAAKWLSSGNTVDIKDIPNNAWDNVVGGTPLEMSVLFDGRGNTRKLIEFVYPQGVPAPEEEERGTLVDAYYFYAPGVASNDSNFGQGKWYIPATGELMDLMGWDWDKLSDYAASNTFYEIDSSNNVAAGYTGTNLSLVNNALQTLADKGVTASPVDKVQSSNPVGGDALYGIIGSAGAVVMRGADLTVVDTGSYDWSTHQYINEAETIANNTKASPNRLSAILENRFRDKVVKPAIGDVMYADLSYGSAADYDGSKTPVGIVYWVSEDGGSARIINLSGIVCKNNNPEQGFICTTDYEHPYSGTMRKTGYENGSQYDNSISIIGSIQYYDEDKLPYLIEETNIPTDGESFYDSDSESYFYDWNQWTKVLAERNSGSNMPPKDTCIIDDQEAEEETEDDDGDGADIQEECDFSALPDLAWFEQQVGADGAVAQTANELRDAINNGKSPVLVYGTIDYLEDYYISLHTGQKLVGVGYYNYGDNKCSQINFKGTTTQAIATNNNSTISDLRLSFDSTNKETNCAIKTIYVGSNKQNVTLRNLDINHTTTCNSGVLQGAVYAYNGTVTIEGMMDINYNNSKHGGLIVQLSGGNITIAEGAEVNINSNNHGVILYNSGTLDVAGTMNVYSSNKSGYGILFGANTYAGSTLIVEPTAEINGNTYYNLITMGNAGTQQNTFNAKVGAKFNVKDNSGSAYVKTIKELNYIHTNTGSSLSYGSDRFKNRTDYFKQITP